MTTRTRALRAIAFATGLAILLVPAGRAQADTFWNGAGDLNWNSSGNWSNGVPGAQNALLGNHTNQVGHGSPNPTTGFTLDAAATNSITLLRFSNGVSPNTQLTHTIGASGVLTNTGTLDWQGSGSATDSDDILNVLGTFTGLSTINMSTDLAARLNISGNGLVEMSSPGATPTAFFSANPKITIADTGLFQIFGDEQAHVNTQITAGNIVGVGGSLAVDYNTTRVGWTTAKLTPPASEMLVGNTGTVKSNFDSSTKNNPNGWGSTHVKLTDGAKSGLNGAVHDNDAGKGNFIHSSQGTDNSITVDLGAQYTFTHVLLWPMSCHEDDSDYFSTSVNLARAYWSNDGSSWTEITDADTDGNNFAEQTSGGGGPAQTWDFTDVTARHFKFSAQSNYGSGPSGRDWVTLAELELWGYGGGDTTSPTVASVSSPTGDGPHGVAAEISIQVEFDEVVNVVGGPPQLTLETGTSDAVVDYASGDGTTTLTFTYTVAAGHESSDLDYQATDSLALNGGTIKDAAGNDADLTLVLCQAMILG